MQYLHDIATIVNGTLSAASDAAIKYLVIDSRKIYFAKASLFFALKGEVVNGHNFIDDAYQKGIRSFVVSDHVDLDKYAGASFITVSDTLHALQQLAAHHRNTFNLPVIGITGSNGKTMVKEGLFQLLSYQYNIVRSPRSYNSQVGVPLALWQIDEANDLGIFEAGISKRGEMERLQNMINPTIGIFTYLGEEHAEGFERKEEKLHQKLLLFTHSTTLIFCADDEMLSGAVKKFKQQTNPELQLFTWGHNESDDVRVSEILYENDHTLVSCNYLANNVSFTIPFTEPGSVHSAITCVAMALFLQLPIENIMAQLQWLKPLQLRMELRSGTNDCSLIIDKYQPDIDSVHIALDFLQQQQQYSKRSVIISELNTPAAEEQETYMALSELLIQKNIYRLVGVGAAYLKYQELFTRIPERNFYQTVDELEENLRLLNFHQECILIKSSKNKLIERVGKTLEKKLHQTVLEINLNAVRHNLKAYRHKMGSGVKMMCMVKAFSYGSGSFEIASLLQHVGVDYLGVAYADEGVELRTAGITLPVMVMNTEEAGFENIINHCLEPELYSLGILKSFLSFLQQKGIGEYFVHLKIETGMHRLGFDEGDIGELLDILEQNKQLKVRSVFSHLAASADPAHDNFSKLQGEILISAADRIEKVVGYSFLRHINNTAGINRHPEMKWDMVRLGIGMYGIDEDEQMQNLLKNVTTLKTNISQLKYVKKGESIGYGRNTLCEKDIKIATVRIGYADGYPRLLSDGVGRMLVNGQLAPVIGRVCMDMTMLDVSNIDVKEEDEVIVFGEALPVIKLAEWAQTIEYEILTNISQRVRRVYYEE